MAQIKKIQLGDTQYNLGTASIPFAKVDSTSTATAFTATVPEITELKDGVCVYLMNGVVTSASGCTLNINNLGAKPIYQTMAAASHATTTFNVAYTMLFVYNSKRISGGCWDIFYGYNTNDNTIAYDVRDYQPNKKAALTIYRYMFCFTKRDGTIFPANNTSNSTATNKTLNTDIAFDPTLPIYYYSTTTTVSSNSSPGASYLWIKKRDCTLQYAFNVSSTALTLNTPVYLQCLPQSNGTLKLANNNCVIQTLPSTVDGYVYLYLGQSYSAYQIELAPMHPCFIYDSIVGDIVVWHGAEYARKNELVNYAPLSSPAFTGTPTIGGYNILTTQDLTKVMHFRGVSSTIITDGGTETATIGGNPLTAEEGDVVIYNNVEFIWNGSIWEQLGDEYKLPIVIDINENDSIITVGNVKGYANNSGYTCTFLAQAYNKVPIYINFINTRNEKQIIKLQGYLPNVSLSTYTGDLYRGFYTETDELTAGNDYSFLKMFEFIILNDNSLLGTNIYDGLATAGATFAAEANHATSADSATSANHADSANSATNANHANSADTAISADSATNADYADRANNANNADYATNANIANSANSADSANIVSTENAIAKYSNTSGAFADTGVTIDNNNNIITSGKITIGVAPTNNMDVATKQYVDNASVSSAATLLTPRTIQTNLTSNTAVSFDGSSDVTPGVTGILGIANGGTGNDDGYIRAGQRSGTTIGTKATAEGNNTTASGNYSHAEGNLTIASGNYSHAEGYNTTASANTGHAEGYDTTASAAGAHAEGVATSALAARSHAEGFSTIAKGTASHVFGEYNEEDVNNITRHSDEGYGNYVEIVGNGSADNARSNARTLDWNGNEILAGKLTVGTGPTANMDVTTKQYVDNLVPSSASISSGVISFTNSSGTTLFTITLPLYNGGVT